MSSTLKTKHIFGTMLLATSALMLACSGNNGIENSSNEGKILLSISASTTPLAGSKATLTEVDGTTNPWLWETGDQLQIIDPDDGTLAGTVTLASGSGEEVGEFSGSVSVTAGKEYMFYYFGKAASTSNISDGAVTISLKSQNGALDSLKNYNVLYGTGTISSTGTSTGTTDARITMYSPFAVAHFRITPDESTYALTKMGVRGKGIYTSASIDLKTGTATGVDWAGDHLQTDSNMFVNTAKDAGSYYDVYLTLVPGTTQPSFDIYYANSYTASLLDVPVTWTTDISYQDPFVKNSSGTVSKFNIGADDSIVAFTRGNLQYVMPRQTYSATLAEIDVIANKLYRTGKGSPIDVTATNYVHKGKYRISPIPWKTAVQATSGSFSYSTLTGTYRYASPNVYDYFDEFSFGSSQYPAALNFTFTVSGNGSGVTVNYSGTDSDWGSKVTINGSTTRTLSFREWRYIFSQRYFSDATSTPMWAYCVLDGDNDGEYNGQNTVAERYVDVSGLVIFPNDMTKTEADKLFVKASNVSSTTTTVSYGTGATNRTNGMMITIDAVNNSGIVFLPATSWRAASSNSLTQIAQHGNYWTAGTKVGGSTIVHINFTQTAGFNNSSNWQSNTNNAGSQVRLVQDITN